MGGWEDNKREQDSVEKNEKEKKKQRGRVESRDPAAHPHNHTYKGVAVRKLAPRFSASVCS